MLILTLLMVYYSLINSHLNYCINNWGSASVQARSQEFVMGGCCGGLGAEPPFAGGQWIPQPPEANGGLGAKFALGRRRQGGLGAEPFNKIGFRIFRISDF